MVTSSSTEFTLASCRSFEMISLFYIRISGPQSREGTECNEMKTFRDLNPETLETPQPRRTKIVTKLLDWTVTETIQKRDVLSFISLFHFLMAQYIGYCSILYIVYRMRDDFNLAASESISPDYRWIYSENNFYVRCIFQNFSVLVMALINPIFIYIFSSDLRKELKKLFL